uniref:Glutamine amidotransferase like class 1 domain containing 1 n=1 Tax=Molossus molossus TaxID=27622 RepID=A0A7J8BIC0_MOLMO|nr:glutamine amidotransferase like class 1 domain containing 1 [Molossus molossus]
MQAPALVPASQAQYMSCWTATSSRVRTPAPRHLRCRPCSSSAVLGSDMVPAEPASQWMPSPPDSPGVPRGSWTPQASGDPASVTAAARLLTCVIVEPPGVSPKGCQVLGSVKLRVLHWPPGGAVSMLSSPLELAVSHGCSRARLWPLCGPGPALGLPLPVPVHPALGAEAEPPQEPG